MCSSAHKAYVLRMLIREIRAAAAGSRDEAAAESKPPAGAPANPPRRPVGGSPATA